MKIASDVLREFVKQEEKLASNATHDDAVKWYEDKLQLRNELILKGQHLHEAMSVTLHLEAGRGSLVPCCCAWQAAVEQVGFWCLLSTANARSHCLCIMS